MPFAVPVIVAAVVCFTFFVLTLKVPVVDPAGMVILDGTFADALLLEIVTTCPPAGAGPVKVTIPIEDFPPLTVLGDSEREERVTVADVVSR